MDDKQLKQNTLAVDPADDAGPQTTLQKRLTAITRKVEARNRLTDKSLSEPKHPVQIELFGGGGAGERQSQFDLIEAQMQSRIRDQIKHGKNLGVTSYPVTSKNEFPRLLSRLPIFRPSTPTTQQKVQDRDNSIPFETGWGKGRRHGPPLTIKDEDTLIALFKIRTHGLSGNSNSFPENLRNIYDTANSAMDVHRTVCTIAQINNFLGIQRGGQNSQETLASVKRLNACQIELETASDNGWREGGSFKLLELRWSTYEDHGLIDVAFPSSMTRMLKDSYFYLNWDIRKNLTPYGKAIHRFLTAQRSDYTISLNKLADAIGYDGLNQHKYTKIKNAIKELEECRWLSAWDISQRGPHRERFVHTIQAKPKILTD